MNSPLIDRRRLMRYYLGGLTDQEESQLEEQYAEDDELFAELMGVQDDLVQAYVRHQLSSEDRAAFERHFMATPGGRDKVRSARTLIEAVDQVDREFKTITSEHERPWSRWFLPAGWRLRWELVTAGFLLAIATGWLLADNWRLRSRLETAATSYDDLARRELGAREAAATERARADGLREALTRNRSKPELAGKVMTVSLIPGRQRGMQASPEFSIPRGASVAVLELALDTVDVAGSYRVLIERNDGRQTWRQDVTAVRDSSPEGTIVLAVSTSILEAGGYTVRLQRVTSISGVEDLHIYQFRVVSDAPR